MKLQYSRARYYDPTTGRFIARDPAGYIDGMSLYEYVNSRPVILVDPHGKLGKKCDSPKEPVANPDWDPWANVNGCGESGGTEIPQVGWDFTNACNAHDACYGKCNSDKAICDLELWTDTSDIRDDWWDSLSWIEKIGNPGWLVCQSMSGGYLLAVDRWGNDAFNSAQDNACTCKCP